jgi:hypothetical protein
MVAPHRGEQEGKAVLLVLVQAGLSLGLDGSVQPSSHCLECEKVNLRGANYVAKPSRACGCGVQIS